MSSHYQQLAEGPRENKKYPFMILMISIESLRKHKGDDQRRSRFYKIFLHPFWAFPLFWIAFKTTPPPPYCPVPTLLLKNEIGNERADNVSADQRPSCNAIFLVSFKKHTPVSERVGKRKSYGESAIFYVASNCKPPPPAETGAPSTACGSGRGCSTDPRGAQICWAAAIQRRNTLFVSGINYT